MEKDATEFRHLEDDHPMKVVKLDEEARKVLTYYPGLQKSSRNTAGVAPICLGYDQANFTSDTSVHDETIPGPYGEALKTVESHE